RHAAMRAERAVTELADRGVLAPEKITTVVFVSSTGSSAPSIDTELVRRFAMKERCRRIALTQLGCGGGVAGLSLAAEIVSRDAAQRVLVVSVELPSLQIQLGEPSFADLIAASQFGDGAAAAILSTDARGPEVVGTESVLLPETDEGGRILPSETGLRLIASGGLPRLVSSRVGDLVGRFARGHGVDPRALSFLVAHPRGGAVLDAIAEGLSAGGLSRDASLLRPSRLPSE